MRSRGSAASSGSATRTSLACSSVPSATRTPDPSLPRRGYTPVVVAACVRGCAAREARRENARRGARSQGVGRHATARDLRRRDGPRRDREARPTSTRRRLQSSHDRHTPSVPARYEAAIANHAAELGWKKVRDDSRAVSRFLDAPAERATLLGRGYDALQPPAPCAAAAAALRPRPIHRGQPASQVCVQTKRTARATMTAPCSASGTPCSITSTRTAWAA